MLQWLTLKLPIILNRVWFDLTVRSFHMADVRLSGQHTSECGHKRTLLPTIASISYLTESQ